MYTLEFYDSIRGVENQYNFSHPISPQQALGVFNKIGFEVHPYSEVKDPYLASVFGVGVVGTKYQLGLMVFLQKSMCYGQIC